MYLLAIIRTDSQFQQLLPDRHTFQANEKWGIFRQQLAYELEAANTERIEANKRLERLENILQPLAAHIQKLTLSESSTSQSPLRKKTKSSSRPDDSSVASADASDEEMHDE